MTLTTRLSLFYLGGLAVVLAGFSVAVYWLADGYLRRQTDERLQAAVQTLVAAAEIRPHSVQWEPGERVLNVGPGGIVDSVAWVIIDPQGHVVDRSSPAAAEVLTQATATFDKPASGRTGRFQWKKQPWQVSTRTLTAAQPNLAELARPERRRRGFYPALVIVAGTPLDNVQATLRTLAAALAIISVIILGVGAVLSRIVCRHALAPVSRMAETARAMDASDLEKRLPALRSADELADLTQAFNGLLDRLQESFERQQRFTADASHQLRTPLTALLGQIEVALRRERQPEEYRCVLEAARNEATRLRQIVETLLFLARADHEARLPQGEPLDLATWLPVYWRTWTQHVRKDDLRLNIAEGTPLWIEAQPVLLAELLNNLIDNSLKYSQAGSPVTVSAAAAAGKACIAVEDRGCGIDAEERLFLFKPFHRAAEARRRGVPGLGLGLAVAHRIVDAFAGTLEVSSEMGKGSCFTVRLPLAEGESPTKNAAATEREIAGAK